jgi:hypothetical protein
MRTSLPLAVALAAAAGDGQPPSGDSGLLHPLVPGQGGVVPLPWAAEQPRKGARAVYDLTADAKPGEVVGVAAVFGRAGDGRRAGA